jgi:hypothetical protein
MFGGTIFRVAKYAIIGAIAIGLGSQLLNYTSNVVIAFRSGNSIPLILVFFVAIIVLRLAGSSLLGEPARTIVNILGWTAAIYLTLTVFVLSLDNGLLFSIVSTAAVTVLCATIRNPSELVLRVNDTLRNSLHLDLSRALMADDTLTDDDIWFYAKGLCERLKVLHVPGEYHELILDVFRKRAEIPLSLHILNDLTVLILDSTSITLGEAIAALQLPDSSEIRECSPTLSKTILAIPLLNAHHGLNITEYSLVTEVESSQFLIDAASSGITIYPSKPDLAVLVPTKLAIGLPCENLSQNELYQLVLERKLPPTIGEKNDHA